MRFDLKLLPLNEASGESDAKIITESNQKAEHAYWHLKKLLKNKKCHKHPSAPNKVRVMAVKGGDPTAQLMSVCCPAFVKLIK